MAKPAETAYLIPGQPGETIQATFTLQDRNAAFRNEFGLFLVDDASGKIGNLKPGDRGYARAAIKNRITVFTRDQNAGAITNITLPAGRYFGTYLIQNSTAAKFLARNPLNQRGKSPQGLLLLHRRQPRPLRSRQGPGPKRPGLGRPDPWWGQGLQRRGGEHAIPDPGLEPAGQCRTGS